MCEQLIEETSAHLITECPALLWERRDAFKVTHDLYETDISVLKIPQVMKFLGNNRVMMMENLSEYPLLFIEDYENDANHLLIDGIAERLVIHGSTRTWFDLTLGTWFDPKL